MKDPMQTDDVRRYEQQLRSLWDSWARKVRSAEEVVLAPSGEEHADRGDEAAEATALEHELDVLAVVQVERDSVRAALDRIAAGTFGRCAKCTEPIARARLDLVPYALECARCAEARAQPDLHGSARRRSQD